MRKAFTMNQKKEHMTMKTWTISILLLLAAVTNPLTVAVVVAENQSPTILDTDYGSFIDDIFAVGLLLQSTDVLDPKLILTTSEEPEWSANCVLEQISRSDLGFDVPVAIGETLPPYSERGTVCGVPGLVGFALHDTCAEPSADPDRQQPIPNGVEHVAQMLEKSERTDWTYIAIGGQTSLQKLIRHHPETLSKIENLVVMGGNWCTGYDPYPGIPSPTGETNIGCDMAAANFVLEAAGVAIQRKQHFPAIHYVPLVTVNVLSGYDYSLITDAASKANNNPHYNKAAEATIGFYKAWSASARNTPGILVHKEAMTFDPSTESTPQFDAVAVLVAIDIVRDATSARVIQHDFNDGVHFVTNQEAEVATEHPEFFKGKQPQAAFSLWSGDEESLKEKIGRNISNNEDKNGNSISNRCQDLTPYHFDPSIAKPFSLKEKGKWVSHTPPAGIRVALGFVSQETEKDFFHEMALRISGRFAPPHSQSVHDTTIPKIIPEQEVSRASFSPVATTWEFGPTQIDKNLSAEVTSSTSRLSSFLLQLSTISSLESSRSRTTIEEYSIYG